MSRVMVFGTFDVLHPGHQYFLRNAHQYGEELIAVVAGDAFVRSYKHKRPHACQAQRMATLRKQKLAEQVIPADQELGCFQVVQQWQPQLIVLGHDQHELHRALQQWAHCKNYPLQVVFLAPYHRHIFSSSRLQQRQRWFYLLGLLSMTCWASGWIAGRTLAQTPLPTSLIVALRTQLTLLSLALPGWLAYRRKQQLVGPLLPALTLAGGLLWVYFFLYFQGLEHVGSGDAALLVSSLSALLLCLIGCQGQLKRLEIRKKLGLLASLAGLALLVQVWTFEKQNSRGLLLLALAACLWAVLTHLEQKIQPQLTPAHYLASLYSITALLSFFPALPHLHQIVEISASAWLALLWIGIVSTALGTGCYFLSVGVLGKERASSLTLLVAPLTLAQGFILLGERPGWPIIPAGVLILLGLALLRLPKIEENRG